ncbi:hypothetical protein HYH02_006764 [Chlamydomonas schloesseri]|uniref:Uncharacterized protein n=1 Tax=Chlamydomonas schloesseri TaxID=2026947 RepID=A0A836B5Y0_9CHLO|nr:hypothetical protein HYH02_006764 [Chlamydomonas schloesseri]|eukprot:KAG2448179.1 hypothetical protein HYH02_006764 [Chlamydomonas schloesseri]
MNDDDSVYTLGSLSHTSMLSSAPASESAAGAATAAATPDGGLAGALSPQQRSALVALACPDLPPSALSGRLHLQAQQRARSALGRHERTCAFGYRPHLRAAATARAVLAAGAGLAPADEAAAARERQAVQQARSEEGTWGELLQAAHRLARGTAVAAADAGEQLDVGQHLLRMADLVNKIDVDEVVRSMAARQASSASEAAERQQVTACGRVLWGPVEGVAVASWLVAKHAAETLPARAVLLLHCHVAVARPLASYEELLGKDAGAVAESRTSGRGEDEPQIRPGGLKCGTYMARAAALAGALWRYWGRPQPAVPGGTSGGGGPTDTAGLHGALQALPPPPGPYPLLCSDLSVLANVVAAAQTLVLQQAPGIAEAAAGAAGVLAALTRPDVLWRAALALSIDLSRVHDVTSHRALQGGITRQFVMDIAKALSSLPAAAAATTGGAAQPQQLMATQAVGPAVCDSGGEAGGHSGGQQLRLELEELRRAWEREQDVPRKYVRRARLELAKGEERLLLLQRRAAAGKAPADDAQQLGKTVAESRRDVIGLEVRCQAGECLVSAAFDALLQRPPPPPAAMAQAAPQAFASTAAAPARVAAAAAAATATPAGVALPRPQRPQVFLLPAGAKEELEHCTSSLRSVQGEPLSGPELRAAFTWSGHESADRESVARAMVGALAPCWEARAEVELAGRGRHVGHSTLPAADPQAAPLPSAVSGPSSPSGGSPSTCSHRHSPSSLVLQGAPAICYSLARTAAVNYVLDKVARGLAVLAASAAESSSDAVGLSSPSMVAVADRLQHLLPQYQRACGWPLVMTLSRSDEAKAGRAEQQAGGVSEELLQQLPPLSGSRHIPELLRQSARLVATWTAQPPPRTRQPPYQAARELRQEPDGGGGCTLQVAVARRLAPTAVPQLSIARGSPTELGCALELADDVLRNHSLRAVQLRPVGDLPTTTLAVMLAGLADVNGATRGASSELVVVPVLDAATMGAGECKEAQLRLMGIVGLVLRDLTRPTALRQQQGAAPAAGGGAAGPLLFCARQLRGDWHHRLPLALNRAVCRVLQLGYHKIGWTLSDLSPQQQWLAQGSGGTPLHHGTVPASWDPAQLLAIEAAGRYVQTVVLPAARSAQERADGLHIYGAPPAAAAAARALAGSLALLGDALTQLRLAAAVNIHEKGDGYERFLCVAKQTQASGHTDPLWALVAGGGRAGGAGSGYGGVPGHSPQSLQLLVAEAAHGRPTELLEGSPDTSGMYELD